MLSFCDANCHYSVVYEVVLFALLSLLGYYWKVIKISTASIV